MPLPVEADETRAVQAALAGWFDEHKRELPWRSSPHREDPYAVLVSEIMLQQTQVETVVPYFEAWMERWPTVEALAEADEDAVLDAWQGLGYYNRARRLHAAAQQIVDEHGGEVPRQLDALESLPGVGPYTAAAVAAFAFDAPVPAVDGNVARVWARLAGEAVDVSKTKTKRRVREALSPVVDGDEPGELVEALMELGATVCTPSAPDCLACPVDAWCTALAEERTHEVPLTADRPDQPTRLVVAVLHETDEGVLFRKRPTDGLLGGLWGLPMAERQPGEALAATAGRAIDAPSVELDEDAIAHVQHTFTHKRWRVRVHRARLPAPPAGEPYARRGLDDIDDLAMATLDRKVLDALAQTTLECFA